MKKIPLSRGAFALVSDEHYPLLNSVSWYAAKGGRSQTLYAVRDVYVGSVKRKYRTMHMHREVMWLILGRPLTATEYPDHIDGNGLNNLPDNLRVATHRQNIHNARGFRNSSSQFKGVNWDASRGLWLARIKADGKQKNLGRFANEIDAAIAYDKAARAAWGDYAYLNFPDRI